MTTESDDSRLIRQVYAGALQRDPEERGEYLDLVCAGKPDLRERVLALLHAHSHEFLDGVTETTLTPGGGTARAPGVEIEGRTLGPYILRRELGRGGMGVVYLADDTRLSRRVALKAITPGLGSEVSGRERLRLEARAAAGLTHQNIATVYALEEFEEGLFLACEFVPGEPLRGLLRSGPLPVEQVVDIGLQLARALAAAHAQGIVHRDIKPENVMQTPSGVVKVLDFGLARLEGAMQSGRLTQTGVILGTPAYLAPEQALGQTADFRTDIFAMGLLIYELASGRNPFAAASITATIGRIIEEDPPPLSHFQPDVPELDRIVTMCLRKNPLERYRSTQEVVSDLEDLLRELQNARRGRPGSGPIQPAPRPARPVWWWEVHQLAASVLYTAMLFPVWYVQRFVAAPWGMFGLLAVLAGAAAATSLRLHLWFVSRNFPAEIQSQHARTRLRLRWADAVFVLPQVVIALVIGPGHPEFAMLFVAASVAFLVAALVIEPLTARVAFGDVEGV